MIKPGVCSVTFRNKSPKEIIELTARAGLCAIEWGSDVHVREGDVENAKEIRKMTEAAGLLVSSYGSYFRLGSKRDFTPFLESAAALGTDEIRIWAGAYPSAYYRFDARCAIVQEAKEISRKAAEYGITVSTECHANTLTDTPESLLLFMHEVNESNFRTYWQELFHIPQNEQMRFLHAAYASGKLTNIHVQHLNYNIWLERLSLFKNDISPRFALLEFVKNGSVESFLEDAHLLTELLKQVNERS